jgi:hypothetical protein
MHNYYVQLLLAGTPATSSSLQHACPARHARLPYASHRTTYHALTIHHKAQCSDKHTIKEPAAIRSDLTQQPLQPHLSPMLMLMTDTVVV